MFGLFIMILSLFSFLDRKPVEIYDNSATLRLGLLENWRRQHLFLKSFKGLKIENYFFLGF